jgi:hypothetical protein
VNLNLHEGIHLQAVIHTAKEIDLKVSCGVNQAALVIRAQFDVDGEGLDIIVKLYT